ncbi:Gfo/Idh/MocA family protein [Halocatena pleomorpha]|uniref:Gfo/Idh/MocA family oxidoreductase n=1 Tax=Halocatena pleomorpha TaxID=1785090 RepID=A0A3P3RL92_9EURY|nr:Gfo/Idh/MocA family oxidoreductase [Halocatena pleomorpha]RRJ33658.1 gfo/Idh/MocA family oxidoreductase [Halocatena pleomorpha]
MSEQISVGVIGVGTMGSHHARAYSELPRADLVGVVDEDDTCAQSVATEYSTRVLDRSSVFDRAEAVSIAVPTHAHAEVAREAIDAGVDVLIEKPFVREPAVGRDLIERAREQDVVLQIGHIERFNPAIQTLMDILADLDVIAVDARRLGPPVDRDLDKSVAYDLMIHDIDVLLALLGSDPLSISAVGCHDNRHVTTTLQFDDGIVGTVTASRLTQQKVRECWITARDCLVIVDYIEQSIRIHRHSLPEYVQSANGVRYRHESITERPTVENGEPLKAELSSFLDSVNDRSEPAVTGVDGLRAVEVVRQIDSLATDPAAGAASDAVTRRPIDTSGSDFTGGM